MRKIILLLLSGAVWADGPSVDVGIEADFATNLAGDSYRAISLSNALGDVDINQCIVSKQKGNVIWSWQNYDYNADCLADKLDRGGRYEEAATLRCQAIPLLAMIVWPNGQTCVQAIALIVPKPPVVVPTSGPLLEDVIVAQEEQGEEYESLEARLARIESGQRIAARKAQQRRDYAQQTVERLENDPED